MWPPWRTRDGVGVLGSGAAGGVHAVSWRSREARAALLDLAGAPLKEMGGRKASSPPHSSRSPPFHHSRGLEPARSLDCAARALGSHLGRPGLKEQVFQMRNYSSVGPHCVNISFSELTW